MDVMGRHNLVLEEPGLLTIVWVVQNYNDFDFGLGNDAGREPRSRNGHAAAQMATRRMKSADNLSGDRWDDAVGGNGNLLPAYDPDGRGGGGSSHKHAVEDAAPDAETEHSKWIHRDKLARIESEELQAAGIFVPRSRAPSKQRQDRSRSAMRRGTDASDQNSHHSRSRKNSSAVEQRQEVVVPSWDLRTPEEIAEEEANAYFTSNALGGTRIPVAKTSPAPISLDHFERGGTTSRKHSESPEGEGLTMAKTRSRSASASLRAGEKPNLTGTLPAGKRSATDMSPKKNNNAQKRQTSGGAKNSAAGAANARPKTRSGSSNGTRPSTRSGESPPNKQPEGDPPWMVNSYKPDPRLPPDQQLLPTVARRLQQEKWEKEGTFGDTYDRDLRPLNDHAFLKPPEGGKPADAAADDDQNEQQEQTDVEWPLKQEAAKSPRQGSYSTMPKITDKAPTSPMASPRPPNTPQMFQGQNAPPSQVPERVPDEKDDGKKEGGCGCCVVM
jgi:hypothetical protein